MSRAFDVVVVGVISIISAVIHRVGVELFAPDQPLYSIATDGTEVMNGAARADLWFQIISIWMPLLAFGGILAWAIVREYRRSVTTAAQARP